MRYFLYNSRQYRINRLRYSWIALVLFTLAAVVEVTSVHHTLRLASLKGSSSFTQQKIFIVGILWNNEIILRDYWIPALVALTKEIGGENVFVSIHGSASLDDTKGALLLLDQLLEESGIPRRVVLDDTTHLDEIAKPASDHGWIETPRGKTELRRIPYLAQIRNAAMKPLYDQQDNGFKYEKILFLNDVVFKVRLLSLGNFSVNLAQALAKF